MKIIKTNDKFVVESFADGNAWILDVVGLEWYMKGTDLAPENGTLFLFNTYESAFRAMNMVSSPEEMLRVW